MTCAQSTVNRNPAAATRVQSYGGEETGIGDPPIRGLILAFPQEPAPASEPDMVELHPATAGHCHFWIFYHDANSILRVADLFAAGNRDR
jgi:hypothetical protein